MKRTPPVRLPLPPGLAKDQRIKGGNNKVGSRPPVYFAEYDCSLAALPEAAETLTEQQYLLDYTPEIA